MSLAFARPPRKGLELLLHFRFRKYKLDLTMRSKGGTLQQKIVEQEAEMRELRLKAEEQLTTLKSQTEEREPLKKSTNDMHTLIQSLKIQARLSFSQLKCGPGELVLLMTFVVCCIVDANLMYLDCGVNYYMKVGN
jgi:hypothetical protein